MSYLCHRYPRITDRDDLMGAALLGLAEAIHRYDPARRASWPGYARRRMSGAIQDEMRRRDPLTRA